MNSPSGSLLPEKDLLNTILADLRRTVREYSTAVTESACPAVRQMFTELTDSSLRLQGDLYQLMASHQMYNAPVKAPRDEVSKRAQSARKTQEDAYRFVQQRLGTTNPYMGAAVHQQSVQHAPHQGSFYS
ncbi:spore coat protein [Paenibacillus sp. CAA11]|uniref:spore coat protein n=1 Tax=Paenibacillus sp. CAA11 TaxID=1532905 RepID=UPI000D3CE0B2|nr:spore coat protein [Paenibacillus sp. CAA11]AWB43951.1 spore coat protein [Paenibacillus sp. CAA11]